MSTPSSGKKHPQPERASPDGDPPAKRTRVGPGAQSQSSRFRMPSSFTSAAHRSGGRTSSRETAGTETEGTRASQDGRATAGTGLLSRTRDRASTIPAGSRPGSPPPAAGSRGATGEQVHDMVLELRAKVDGLAQKVEGMEAGIKRLSEENAKLLTKASTLAVENQEVAEGIAEYAEHVEALEERVEDLLGHLERGEGASPEARELGMVGPSAVDEVAAIASATSAELRTRDFFSSPGLYMGLQKKDQAPEPMKRGFWTHEDPRHPDRHLRPRWDEGWPENRAAWVAEVVLKVRQEGRRWSGALSQERLDALPADVIESGLETCFNRVGKQLKASQESNGKARDEKARVNRRRQRKRNKAVERWEHRHTVAELMQPEYEFAFHWHYQSTDESDSKESAIDPNTEDEDGGTNGGPSSGSRGAAWIQRAPAYRVGEVIKLLDRLDAAILVALKGKGTGAGNTRHTRRTSPRTTASPSPSPAAAHMYAARR
ncbi:hypothetical protein LXA43DRAFT_1098153 [Ganoderma leucocontextum]|nr:hypothetical protein LXA43DRAFT_1098153 [Ganoderma leucocontextum]